MLAKMQIISNKLQRLVPVLIFIDLLLALAIGYQPGFVKSLEPLITPAMILMLVPPMMGLVIRELHLVARDKNILSVALLMIYLMII